MPNYLYTPTVSLATVFKFLKAIGMSRLVERLEVFSVPSSSSSGGTKIGLIRCSDAKKLNMS